MGSFVPGRTAIDCNEPIKDEFAATVIGSEPIAIFMMIYDNNLNT